MSASTFDPPLNGMIVRLKPGLLIVTAMTDHEAALLADWAKAVDGHVFMLKHQDGRTVRLTDLGPRAQACREPINVVSTSSNPQVQLISNLAHTPFELDHRTYASVEGFWQGLKFSDEGQRQRIAQLHGQEARKAGRFAEKSDVTHYGGRVVRIGTYEHWQLMYHACKAKFTQHEAAKQALLDTGERPLLHKTLRDSRTIPGVMMADIWMRIRRQLYECRPSR